MFSVSFKYHISLEINNYHLIIHSFNNIENLLWALLDLLEFTQYLFIQYVLFEYLPQTQHCSSLLSTRLYFLPRTIIWRWSATGTCLWPWSPIQTFSFFQHFTTNPRLFTLLLWLEFFQSRGHFKFNWVILWKKKWWTRRQKLEFQSWTHYLLYLHLKHVNFSLSVLHF